jgi:hypothetical protein
MATTNSSEYVDEAGLDERYLIPRRTAQRWRATGQGPRYVRLGPRRILYRVADVEAWLAGRTYAHRAEEMARQN